MHKVLQFHIPSIESTAYADNWSLIAYHPQDLHMGANLLHECVGVLHMQLAPQKSWVWATNPKWKKELSISFDNVLVPFKSNAIDLGCDLHYGAKKILHARNKRRDKAKRVVKKISKIKAPRGFKRLMASASGYWAFALLHMVVSCSMTLLHFGQPVGHTWAFPWEGIFPMLVPG